MATYAQNLAEAERINSCGVGMYAIVPDPAVDLIIVKDPTADNNCGQTQVLKSYHGGQAEVGMSVEPDSLAN
jgi:hypothetical protein